MAAFAEGLASLKLEVDAIRQQFESLAPKFGDYDMMVSNFQLWKQEVEKMLLAQNEKQTETVTKLQDLSSKADSSITAINTKLRDNPTYQRAGREKMWELSRPTDLEPNVFSGKEDDWASGKKSKTMPTLSNQA